MFELSILSFVLSVVGGCFALWCIWQAAKIIIRVVLMLIVPLASFALGAVILYIILLFV